MSNGQRKGREGCGNISSCCTGSSGPIDVSAARTRAPSTSCRHRWAARKRPAAGKKNKTQDKRKALAVLPPTRFPQTLTFPRVTSEEGNRPSAGFSQEQLKEKQRRLSWFEETSAELPLRISVAGAAVFRPGPSACRVFPTTPDHTGRIAHLLLHNENCLNHDRNN